MNDAVYGLILSFGYGAMLTALLYVAHTIRRIQ